MFFCVSRYLLSRYIVLALFTAVLFCTILASFTFPIFLDIYYLIILFLLLCFFLIHTHTQNVHSSAYHPSPLALYLNPTLSSLFFSSFEGNDYSKLLLAFVSLPCHSRYLLSICIILTTSSFVFHNDASSIFSSFHYPFTFPFDLN